MSKITLDNLSDNLKEYLEGLGLSEEQVLNLINENGLDEEELKAMLKDTMSINELNTSSKTVIGAINELFQSANNGKELIANAIGEPLDASDTFSAMSTGINSLLSTFKTNMMIAGVAIGSGDKFKQLIDKIATLADSGDSGIQYAEGISVINSNTETNTYTDLWGNTQNISTLRIDSLNFKPNIVLLYTNAKTPGTPSPGITTYIKGVCLISGMAYKFNSSPANWALKFNDDDISFDNGFVVPCSTYGTCNWYAIGVGEEDTTLRDSLASILEEEGVTTTEEDDMASLIGKVDQEFDENKQELVDVLVSKGVECSTNNSFDELIANINNIGGIQTSPTSFNDALYYNGDSADITNNLTCCTYTSKFNGTIRVLVRVSSNYGSGAKITATYYKNNNKVGSSSCSVSYNSPEFGKDCVYDIDVEKNDVITVVLTYSGDGPKYHHTVILASF